MNSALPKTADAMLRAAGVTSGRVSKKKAPPSKGAPVVKAPSKVQARPVSKKKDSASLSKEEDALEEPPVMVARGSKKKGPAALSKVEGALEEPLAGGSKKKADGEVRLRKYVLCLILLPERPNSSKIPRQGPPGIRGGASARHGAKVGESAVPSLS
jgi:hypothetical protein